MRNSALDGSGTGWICLFPIAERVPPVSDRRLAHEAETGQRVGEGNAARDRPSFSGGSIGMDGFRRDAFSRRAGQRARVQFAEADLLPRIGDAHREQVQASYALRLTAQLDRR